MQDGCIRLERRCSRARRLTHRGVGSALGAVVEVVEVGVLGLPGEGGGAHRGRRDEEAVAEGRQDLQQGTHLKVISAYKRLRG